MALFDARNKKAKLVKGFNQGKHIICTLPNTKNGACVGFSLWWIVYHRNEWSTFWRELDKGEHAFTGVRTAAQNELLYHIDIENESDIWKRTVNTIQFLKQHGLSPIRNGVQFSSKRTVPNAKNVTDMIHGHKGYKYLLYDGFNGHHACAGYRGKDHLLYFDPNGGVVRFQKKSDFENWFGHYWKSSYCQHGKYYFAQLMAFE